MKAPTTIKDADGRAYRAETEAVFRHIVGGRKRVREFDQFGFAILVFRIAAGKHAGYHSVAIEPRLIRKVAPPRSPKRNG
jgi:hypothetical protein